MELEEREIQEISRNVIWWNSHFAVISNTNVSWSTLSFIQVWWLATAEFPEYVLHVTVCVFVPKLLLFLFGKDQMDEMVASFWCHLKDFVYISDSNSSICQMPAVSPCCQLFHDDMLKIVRTVSYGFTHLPRVFHPCCTSLFQVAQYFPIKPLQPRPFPWAVALVEVRFVTERKGKLFLDVHQVKRK